MSLQHNIPALNAQRQYNIAGKSKAKQAEKLSSGYRINRAADDAAGLAISEKMRGQIRGLNRGIQNAEDGISLCQVADGALNEVHGILQRLGELSVQAANGTDTDYDREMIQDEVGQLLAEIDRISDTTTFNRQRLFNGVEVGKMTATPTNPATPAVGSTQTICGDFTVQGGILGNDFDFQNGTLIIRTSTAILVRNTTPGSATTHRIEVAKDIDANIILKDVNIDVRGIGTSFQGFSAFKIEDDSTGKVKITLDGKNVLTSGTDCAGLQKNGEGSGTGELIISGTGSLTATGGSGGAGIGGGDGAGSNITINGGTVTATGGRSGAGIGGGDGAGNNITINGGTVSAIGGFQGAGIGGGDGAGSNITISGGTVSAIGGFYGAGIGGGGHPMVNEKGAANNITISGGTVSAIGGSQGAGIGGGAVSMGSNITISGGTVSAIGGSNPYDAGAGIGGGDSGAGSHITISGGSVYATGGSGAHPAAGIGGGGLSVGRDITISGGSGWAKCDPGAQKIGNGNIVSSGTNNTVNGSPAPADATDRLGGTFPWNLPDQDTPTDPTQPSPTDPGSQSSTSLFKQWWIQYGSNEHVGMYLVIDAMDTRILGLTDLSVTTQENASDAIGKAAYAITRISKMRGKIGAQQNRLEHAISNGGNMAENLSAAESRIRDANMAREMLRYSISNIITQVGESIMAQANQSEAGVLELLK